MVVRYETSRGKEVIGLAVPNSYAGEDWDLGPTWCYLIKGSITTLIDAGRLGTLDALRDMLKTVGVELPDIDRLVVTHSHEDHDGNLASVLEATGAELWAHTLYRYMISYYPDIHDGARHPEMPVSCRLCNMPEKFYCKCLPYHRERSKLAVDFVISDDRSQTRDDLSFIFTPGHSPDAICIVLDNEVIFTGDTVLPDITPHPSLELASEANRRILPEAYRSRHAVYGLMAYIKSLHKIIHLDFQLLEATFPAHRLFYGGRFNIIHSPAQRSREIIQFHIDRCRAILDIVSRKPVSAQQIAEEYFPPSRLRGSGKLLAQNEIIAHLEVMEECGDIRRNAENRDLVESTGSSNFLSRIGAYLQE